MSVSVTSRSFVLLAVAAGLRARRRLRSVHRSLGTLLLVLALAPGACGGGGGAVEGVVVDVQGDLEQVESFSVRTPGGETLRFVPAPDLRLHGGPLSHLRQHVVSGEPVLVRYVSEGDRLVAVEVRDA